MKAKDLAKLLLKYPDFEVKIITTDSDHGYDYIDYYSWDITGIADVGHSDKVVILDCDDGELLEDYD